MKTGLKRFLCVQMHFWPFTCVSGGGRGVTLIGNRYVSGDTVTWFLDPGLSALIEITWPLARVVTRGRDSWNGACQQLSQHQGKITSVGQVKHTFKPVQHVKKSAQHFSADRLLNERRGGGLICAVSNDDRQFSPVFLGFTDILSALPPSFYCPDSIWTCSVAWGQGVGDLEPCKLAAPTIYKFVLILSTSIQDAQSRGSQTSWNDHTLLYQSNIFDIRRNLIRFLGSLLE